MKLAEFYDVMQSFSKADTVADITTLCQLHSKDLGFDNFIYALRMPTQFADSKLVLIDGYPANWVSHYFERTYQTVDPVLAYCGKHIIPIAWQNLKPLTTGAAKQMMLEAGDFGLKSGITMPVHSPRGEMGILSLTVNQSAKTSLDVTESALPYIQIFAGYLHEAVRRVFNLVEDPKPPQLTVRDQECLRWAADGKTSWEIAKLLSVSERTINFHMNNAMLKLNVTNRQHAVAKVTLQGLVQPLPF